MRIENLTAQMTSSRLFLCKIRYDKLTFPRFKARFDMVTSLIGQKGFTLIEVIITIILTSILAVSISVYFGKNINQSAAPLISMRDALNLQTVMENITAHYKSLYNSSTLRHDIATLKTNIGSEGASMSNGYGTYEVIDNRYIKFVSNNAEDATGSDLQNLLKVTLKGSTGVTLTLVFSRGDSVE